MAKLTIIVPIFNTEKYLEKCLSTLLNQTLQDIEIILVDDGSTDNSADIIKKFNNKYPNKIIYLSKKNGGLSDARNFAIPYANGEFIGFVDSDDYIDLDMYEKMYNLAIKNHLDLVECNFIWEYPKKNKIDKGINYINNTDFFVYGRVMACNKIFRTNIIKQYNLNFSTGLRYEDVDFFYKYISYVKKSGLVEDTYYHYMQRDNSIINNQNEKTADIFIILNNIIDYYKNKNLYSKHINELEYLFIRILLGSSFKRIVKIKNKKIKKDLLNKTLIELNTKFPNWKKNKLLNTNKSLKNKYYKSINKFTFKIYSIIFKFI